MIQITLMEAYLIETLRHKGLTNDAILKHVHEKRVDELQKYHDSFDFTGLYALEDHLATILQEGYQIKFLTMPGLINLLRMKYNKELEKDYIAKETSLENLTLTTEEKSDLENWLAANWQLVENEEKFSIVPRHSH